ncbi:MAG: hypothetical protein ACRCSN_12955 [Dermatophilaceae bacterium]
MTGLVGTLLILTGYLLMALRRDPAVAFATASLIWMIHGFRQEDWWLFTANLIAVVFATIAVIRAQRAKRAPAEISGVDG